MIITGSSSCFPNGVPAAPQGMQMYAVSHLEDMISSSINEAASSSAAGTESSHSGNNFLYNLSILKDKIYQVQSLANFFISPNENQQPSESTAIAIASIGSLIQEIIVTATSVLYTCQQMMALGVGNNNNNNNNLADQPDDDLNNVPSGSRVNKDQLDHAAASFGNPAGVDGFVRDERGRGQGFYMSDQSLDWSCGNDHTYDNKTTSSTRNISVLQHVISNKNTNDIATRVFGNRSHVTNINVSNKINKDLPIIKGGEKRREGLDQLSPNNYDIVELNAADILAKYTHYCQVCGKGFKRDANLRMHMRAHGDEYKSSAALSNPLKNIINGSEGQGKVAAADGFLPRKYSCPHEGCRWNKKHAKFQPLKSMICVKNHYKRSHCPKMYVCKRCNRKQFSVLSDLRTHEKHCGDLKWQCSCGTTFSRKDKLMGHVALFVGHTPAVSSLAKMGKVES